jgi:hypothetical protein
MSTAGHKTSRKENFMNQHKSTAWMTTAAFLVTGFLAASPAIQAAAAVPDSEQVSQLLSEAKTMAFQLKEDAQTMESYTRSSTTWQSHAIAINQIKERINALGRQAAKLRDAKSTASPWQKTAIDRINPLLEELAGYTEAVIEHVNKQPQLLTTPEYMDYLEANADYAGELATMIAEFVDYGKAKQRLQSLSDKLEIPAR